MLASGPIAQLVSKLAHYHARRGHIGETASAAEILHKELHTRSSPMGPVCAPHPQAVMRADGQALPFKAERDHVPAEVSEFLVDALKSHGFYVTLCGVCGLVGQVLGVSVVLKS